MDHYHIYNHTIPPFLQAFTQAPAVQRLRHIGILTLPPKPFSSTERMVKHLRELAGSLKDHEKAVFLQVFQYRITERKARLRSTHYEEVSQTFREASEAGVEFWEIQVDFRPEGVTLYRVMRSTDL